jgi:purine nucleosidase
MAIAIDESICTRRSRHFVDVACAEEVTRGMTVVDELNVTGREANMDVCWGVDVKRWKEALYGSLQ